MTWGLHPELDEYPDLHYAEAYLSDGFAEFGTKLPFRGASPTLKQATSSSPLSADDRERVRRVQEIPVEERMWCILVLEAAFATIRSKLQEELSVGDDEAALPTKVNTKTLPVVGGSLLHIDRLEPCGEPHKIYYATEPENDERVAFDVVVHVYAHSKLAHFFANKCDEGRGPIPAQGGAEPSSHSFQPANWNVGPHPSTWGFEVYPTQKWQQTLKEWSGRIEEKILRHSVIKACGDALKEIKRAERVVLAALAEEQEQQEQEESMQQLLHADCDISLELAASSYHHVGPSSAAYNPHNRCRTQCARAAPDPFSRDRLFATGRPQKEPTAFVRQLSYDPVWVLARGPSPASAPASTPSTAPPDSGSSSANSSSAYDASCDSGCSTPRASTPVARKEASSAGQDRDGFDFDFDVLTHGYTRRAALPASG